MSQPAPGLLRRLSTTDAVVIGLGSMIGAGAFAAFGPAAKAAGSGLLVGLLIAAIIAYCNAAASAQLAAVYPTSGGTYVYGRERLGEWWGFLAGWGFVIGKTASCAAMAMTFAAYVLPGERFWQRLVAVAAVVVLTSLNSRGVTRTATMTNVFVSVSLTCLAIVVASILFRGHISASRLEGGWSSGNGIYGVLQAGGLLFFAFAGYARVATMGEEVRDPARPGPFPAPSGLRWPSPWRSTPCSPSPSFSRRGPIRWHGRRRRSSLQWRRRVSAPSLRSCASERRLPASGRCWR